MLKIWLLNTENLSPSDIRLADHIHPARLTEIRHGQNLNGQKCSIGCELLLTKYIREHIDPSATPSLRSLGAYEKPYLPNYPALHYNFSHAAHWSVLAVSDRTVGVDLEKIRAPKPNFIERFFHPDEVSALTAETADTLPLAFTEYWVIKESILKMLGSGLHTPLSSFAVTRNALSESCLNGRFSYQLLPSGIPDFALAACLAGTTPFTVKVTHLTADSIFST